MFLQLSYYLFEFLYSFLTTFIDSTASMLRIYILMKMLLSGIFTLHEDNRLVWLLRRHVLSFTIEQFELFFMGRRSRLRLIFRET